MITIPSIQAEKMAVQERVSNQLTGAELSEKLTGLERQGFPLAAEFSKLAGNVLETSPAV